MLYYVMLYVLYYIKLNSKIFDILEQTKIHVIENCIKNEILFQTKLQNIKLYILK